MAEHARRDAEIASLVYHVEIMYDVVICLWTTHQRWRVQQGKSRPDKE